MRAVLTTSLAVACAILTGTFAPSVRAEDPPPPKAGDPPAKPEPAPAPDPPAEKVSLDTFLKGAVLSLDKNGAFEVHYDFTDPAQMEDFRDSKPFRVVGGFKREIVDRKLHMRGTGGLVWRPVLTKNLRMNFTMRLAVARDVGAYILEDRDSEHYTLFSVYDQYFQNKDSPGSAKVHMICRFLPASAEFAGDLVFRYVTRNASPPLGLGSDIPVEVGREGIDDWFILSGSKMAGSESNWPALRGLRPGFYTLDSEAWYGDLTMRGTLDPAWAEANGVDLALPLRKKPTRPVLREPGPADATAMASVEAFTLGTGSATEMLRIVAEPALVDPTRKAAADALIATADAHLVPRCVPLLESEDLQARTLADAIVNALVGRTFGYKPDAPEDKRRKALRSLIEHIEKNPKKFK
jgi:hypothetical protein